MKGVRSTKKTEVTGVNPILPTAEVRDEKVDSMNLLSASNSSAKIQESPQVSKPTSVDSSESMLMDAVVDIQKNSEIDSNQHNGRPDEDQMSAETSGSSQESNQDDGNLKFLNILDQQFQQDRAARCRLESNLSLVTASL